MQNENAGDSSYDHAAVGVCYAVSSDTVDQLGTPDPDHFPEKSRIVSSINLKRSAAGPTHAGGVGTSPAGVVIPAWISQPRIGGLGG